MRILVVGSYYKALPAGWNSPRPGRQPRAYAGPRGSFDETLFGETSFEVKALHELGHEAWDSIASLRPAQRAFAREHGVAMPGSTWAIRRRGSYIRIPWNVPD